MLFCLLFAVLATLIVFPGSAVGRALHRSLIEPLARRLDRIRPGHLAFAAVLIALVTTLIVLFEWEGVRLVGMAAPDLIAWLGMFDAAAVMDLAAVAIAMAATTRFRAVRDRVLERGGQAVAIVRAVLKGVRRRARRGRPTSPRPPRSDDPEPGAAGAYAFG